MDLTHLQSLKVYKLRLICQTKSLLHLGPFWGSALHGILGHSLKQNLCITRTENCTGCPEISNCDYQRIFHPRLPAHHPHARKYAEMPQPFIIQKDLFGQVVFLPGHQFSLGINIVGSAIADYKHFIEAFGTAGKTGIGKHKGRFEIQQVEYDRIGSGDFVPLYHGLMPEPVNYEGIAAMKNIRWAKLWFFTPLHLKARGNVVSSPPFELLINRIHERLQLLNHFYCNGGELDAQLSIQTAEIETQHHLEKFSFGRFSNRHEKRLDLNGMIGSILLKGNLDDYLPLLLQGSLLNVGKMATIGMGQYRVEYGR